MPKALVRLLLIVLLPAGVVFAETKFTSTWKAPEASNIHFRDKKVAVLVISRDENLRVSGEEGLARELAARGVQTVAAYRLVPREELESAAKARGWFERAGIDGVVAMRPVSLQDKTTYVPSTWSTSYYTTLWGYYGYGWGAVYDPGYVRRDTRVVIETLIYSVPLDKLLWAGVSETVNPKDTSRLLADLVKAAAKEMREQGLTPGLPRQ